MTATGNNNNNFNPWQLFRVAWIILLFVMFVLSLFNVNDACEAGNITMEIKWALYTILAVIWIETAIKDLNDNNNDD